MIKNSFKILIAISAIVIIGFYLFMSNASENIGSSQENISTECASVIITQHLDIPLKYLNFTTTDLDKMPFVKQALLQISERNTSFGNELNSSQIFLSEYEQKKYYDYFELKNIEQFGKIVTYTFSFEKKFYEVGLPLC